MAITVKVTGQGTGTVAGSIYTASVPVTAFDFTLTNEQWKVAQTVLTVTGPTTDTAAMVKTNLQTAATAWRTSLAAKETFAVKLANLEGTTL